MLIKRKEGNKNIYYSNIGTGNYNEETAKVFADDSLFTCDPDIASDVEKVFDLFENNYRPLRFKTLIVSPFYMRNFFRRMIQREIFNAKTGKEAWMILKLNNLVDIDIVTKLYEASCAGVKIKIIARGTCILKAGIPGLSENIEAISIVDNFLEHSRVLVFCNGGDEKYYLSSADWMKRNFDYRVEVACPVNDVQLQQELKAMLDIQLKDNMKARLLSYDRYNHYKTTKGKKQVRSQFEIYDFLKKIHIKVN